MKTVQLTDIGKNPVSFAAERYIDAKSVNGMTIVRYEIPGNQIATINVVESVAVVVSAIAGKVADEPQDAPKDPAADTDKTEE